MVRAFVLRMLPLLGNADCFEGAARGKKETVLRRINLDFTGRVRDKRKRGAREKVQQTWKQLREENPVKFFRLTDNY